MSRPLEGKNVLVTGANTGIGRVTARVLAERGARVFLACRSEERAAEALAECRAHGEAEVLRLDLSRLDSVRECVAGFLDRDLPLHVLVANAGLAGLRGTTADGFELAFGVNHVGHFALTMGLLPAIERAGAPGAAARVVVVSSKSHYRAKGIDWQAVRERTRSVTGMPEYEVSKLANVLFARELARRLGDAPVRTYSLHPGVIASDVWREVPFPLRGAMKLFMKSNEQGAQTSIKCATDPSLEDATGRYYDTDGAERRPSRLAQDDTLAATLWRHSQTWTGTGS